MKRPFPLVPLSVGELPPEAVSSIASHVASPLDLFHLFSLNHTTRMGAPYLKSYLKSQPLAEIFTQLRARLNPQPVAASGVASLLSVMQQTLREMLQRTINDVLIVYRAEHVVLSLQENINKNLYSLRSLTVLIDYLERIKTECSVADIAGLKERHTLFLDALRLSPCDTLYARTTDYPEFAILSEIDMSDKLLGDYYGDGLYYPFVFQLPPRQRAAIVLQVEQAGDEPILVDPRCSYSGADELTFVKFPMLKLLFENLPSEERANLFSIRYEKISRYEGFCTLLHQFLRSLVLCINNRNEEIVTEVGDPVFPNQWLESISVTEFIDEFLTFFLSGITAASLFILLKSRDALGNTPLQKMLSAAYYTLSDECGELHYFLNREEAVPYSKIVIFLLEACVNEQQRFEIWKSKNRAGDSLLHQAVLQPLLMIGIGSGLCTLPSDKRVVLLGSKNKAGHTPLQLAILTGVPLVLYYLLKDLTPEQCAELENKSFEQAVVLKGFVEGITSIEAAERAVFSVALKQLWSKFSELSALFSDLSPQECFSLLNIKSVDHSAPLCWMWLAKEGLSNVSTLHLLADKLTPQQLLHLLRNDWVYRQLPLISAVVTVADKFFTSLVLRLPGNERTQLLKAMTNDFYCLEEVRGCPNFNKLFLTGLSPEEVLKVAQPTLPRQIDTRGSSHGLFLGRAPLFETQNLDSGVEAKFDASSL